MYFRLTCNIRIETENKTVTFNKVNTVSINKSIDSIRSTAKIIIPKSAILKDIDGTKSSTQTNIYFSQGNKVTINLAYNNTINQEFIGFISKITAGDQTEIELQGYEWQLRENITPKSYKTTTLIEVLKYITEGTDIVLMGDKIPNINMQNYVIPANLTKIEALQQIKQNYGITIYFIDNKLYAGLDFTNYLGEVKLSIGENTIKDNNLQYFNEDERKFKVRAVQVNKDNTKFETEVGDSNGELRTLFFYTAKSKADLEKLATAEMEKLKVSGYTGKITTFLLPYIQHGMVANIRDINYPERDGKFEVRSIDLSFGTGGARRICKIGKKMSN